MIYVIGSLRDETIPVIARRLRDEGIDVFDEWYAAGPSADDWWRDYEKERGRSFVEAIRESKAVDHIFDFDYAHLEKCDAAILVAPAGRSAHLELGYVLGRGKTGVVYVDPDTDRWDVMYRFANDVFDNMTDLVAWAKGVTR